MGPLSTVSPSRPFLPAVESAHGLRGVNGNFLLLGPSQHDSGRLRLETLNQRVHLGRGFPQALINTAYFQHVVFGSSEVCPLWLCCLASAAQKNEN